MILWFLAKRCILLSFIKFAKESQHNKSKLFYFKRFPLLSINLPTTLWPVHTNNDSYKDNYNNNYISVHTKQQRPV